MQTTAGPWRIANDLNHVDEIAVTDEVGIVICGVVPVGELQRDRVEQMANARAIAATPKLIALAERIADCFPHDAPVGNDARALLKEIENG